MPTATAGWTGGWTAWSGCRMSLSPVLVLLLAGCGGLQLESGRRDRPIAVDGKADEWSDSLTVIKDAQIAVGLLNDQPWSGGISRHRSAPGRCEGSPRRRFPLSGLSWQKIRPGRLRQD